MFKNLNPRNETSFCPPLIRHPFKESLIERALEDPSLVFGLLEGHSKLKQGGDCLGKVLEESIAVLGIQLGVLLEALVLNKLHVSGQHHEALGLDILKLLGTIPLLVRPLLLEEQLEVVVGQGSGREGPGAVKAGAVGVAAAEGVGAREGDHGTVIESHAAKDGADVAAILGGIGQTAIRSAEGDITIGTASTVRNLRTLHLLDGANTTENPQVRVADPRESLLDGLEEVASSLETSIGTVVSFGGKAHGCAVGATSSRQLVIAVACQSLVQ